MQYLPQSPEVPGSNQAGIKSANANPSRWTMAEGMK
jgi:hypothetical protein